jgi:hypothetical protein
MPPVGFETTILGSERPKIHALDRAATGIGQILHYLSKSFILQPINTTILHASTSTINCLQYFYNNYTTVNKDL